MTNPDMPSLEFNGEPPELAGLVCEAFICEAYEYKGQPIAQANVTYLKFEGAWFRLYFEPWMVFWRSFSGRPEPWCAEKEHWNCPHTDVGVLAGVVGARLVSYETSPTKNGSKAVFHFDNGRAVVIEDEDDRTSYAVI